MPASNPTPRTSAHQTVIAVDARTLSQTGKGVPRFLAETLRELAKDNRFRIVLLSTRPLHPAHALPLETVIDSKWRRIPGSIWLLTRFNALAVRIGADIVWGSAQVLPGRHRRLRSVMTVHDLVHRIMPESMSDWNRRISKWLVEPSIHRADRIVAVSETTRDDILSLVKPNRKNIVVAHLGARIVPPDEAGRAQGIDRRSGNYLFSLGSIEPRKNIDGLLQAFERLQAGNLLKSDRPLTLRLTGAHSWGASETLEAIGRNDACELLGFLSETELASQMAHARAFVMPSHYEGFGLPIIEAVGLAPIIASDIAVFRELSQFIDGIHFVDFSDPDAAAAAIAAFLANDPPPARFKPGSESKFQWRNTAQIYADVFLDERRKIRS